MRDDREDGGVNAGESLEEVGCKSAGSASDAVARAATDGADKQHKASLKLQTQWRQKQARSVVQAKRDQRATHFRDKLQQEQRKLRAMQRVDVAPEPRQADAQKSRSADEGEAAAAAHARVPRLIRRLRAVHLG